MRVIILTICMLATLFSSAQNCDENANGITVCLPSDNYSIETKRVFENKLKRILDNHDLLEVTTIYGLKGELDVLSREVESSFTPRYVYDVGISLFLGDGVNGNSSSFYEEVRGFGSTNNSAIRDAINKFRVNSPEIVEFVNRGKDKITTRYTTSCEMVLNDAKMLFSIEKSEEAVKVLTNLPKDSPCWDQAIIMTKEYYQNSKDMDCLDKLLKAKGIFTVNKNAIGAKMANSVLTTISPRSSCYDEAVLFEEQMFEVLYNQQTYSRDTLKIE